MKRLKAWKLLMNAASIALLILMGTAAARPFTSDFQGIRIRDSHAYVLEIQRMNGNDWQTMELRAGDVVQIAFETEKGGTKAADLRAGRYRYLPRKRQESLLLYTEHSANRGLYNGGKGKTGQGKHPNYHKGEKPMKSLKTIQKTLRVFQILTKIIMILTFLWAALGMLSAMVWQRGGIVIRANREWLQALAKTSEPDGMTAFFLAQTIQALADGTLLAFAYYYLKLEQADGTPFTQHGARQIRSLGIRTIVLSVVARIVIAAIGVALGLPLDAVGNRGLVYAVAMGVLFVLASLVLRYGAELDGRQ